jgi:3-oxoacyl-[acyl-carrier protein] reductase
MPVALSLEGQVALVTGGSRGIGAAIVRMFVAAGARVFFNYEKAREQADRLCEECGPADCAAEAKTLDSPAAAGELVAACVKKFGRLDILVANHGIWPPEDAPIDKMTDQQWGKTVAVNLDSVFGLVTPSRR